MEEYLRRKGYIIDFTGKHWKIRLPQYEHFTRLDTLNEKWTPENILRSMGRGATFGSRRAYISYPPQMPQELKDPQDKPYLPFVSALLLSARLFAEKYGLQTHKPVSKRGLEKIRGDFQAGAIYG